MTKEWRLLYEIHHIIFGIAFLLLAGSCLYAVIRAQNNSPFNKSRISYAVNAVFIIFYFSRALTLLLHAYGSGELSTKFIFNIGWPCLMTANAYTIRSRFKCLKYRARNMVVLQCYAFIIIEIAETTVPDGPHIGLHIHFLLAFCLFVCGVCAYIVHAKIFVSSTFDISKYRKDMTKLDSLNAEIIEVSNCEKEGEDVVDNRRGACIEVIVTFLIFC